jgi:hypothetical protein
MAFPVAARKQAFNSAPRAFQASGPAGQAVALSVSAVAGFISLAAGFSQASKNRQTGDDPVQASRNFLTIECDVDLAVIFGQTQALVTTTNAPVIATVGTLTAGVYAGAAGTAFVIYAKQPTRILLQDTLDLYMGFVAAGAGTMRLYQSSNDNA